MTYVIERPLLQGPFYFTFSPRFHSDRSTYFLSPLNFFPVTGVNTGECYSEDNDIQNKIFPHGSAIMKSDIFMFLAGAIYSFAGLYYLLAASVMLCQ